MGELSRLLKTFNKNQNKIKSKKEKNWLIDLKPMNRLILGQRLLPLEQQIQLLR